MFNLRNYYKKENDKIHKSYIKTVSEIKDICKKTKNSANVANKEKYYMFFNKVGNHILKMVEYEKEINEDLFSTNSVEELRQFNNSMYEEILPETTRAAM